jgi:hypothetical protein
MKTPALFILLTLLSFQPLWSQSYRLFPDTNATWCDERSDNGMPTHYFYFFYKTNGKSNINDTVYTVISDNYGEITCYLREENKKVFCRSHPDLPEFLMYNFNIEIGDTVLVPQYANGPSSPGYVEEADSILIGTQYHKRYFIQCPEWHSIFKTDGSGGNEAGNCWQYIGIPETTLEQMEIYPNPVTDYIHISFDKECRLELIDLTGRQCRQSLSNTMFVKDREQGIYLLRVYSVTGTLLNQLKILKLNER